MTLHVYFDGMDWIVAENEDDARALWLDYTGEKPEDYIDGELYFEELSDDKKLRVYDEDRSASIEQTCREWADQYGRGFLCSTEY